MFEIVCVKYSVGYRVWHGNLFVPLFWQSEFCCWEVDNLIGWKNLGIVIKLGSFPFNNFFWENTGVISWISQPAVDTTQASTTHKNLHGVKAPILCILTRDMAPCGFPWEPVTWQWASPVGAVSILPYQMWYQEKTKVSPGDWHSRCTKAQCWVLVHSEKSLWKIIFHAGECHMSLAGLFTLTEKLRVTDKT